MAAVENAMVAWVYGHPEVLDIETIARKAVREYDENMRPRMSRQMAMFEPLALLPVGNKQRVWMKDATREHLVAWWSIETAEHVASAAAYQTKGQYFNSRFQNWRAEYERLIDVERGVFGWTEDSAASTDIERDDESEAG